MNFSVTPTGYPGTPSKTVDNMPVQPSVVASSEGRATLYHELTAGLKDLDSFLYIVLLSLLHEVEGYQLEVVSFTDNMPHGVLVTRSSERPSHIGMPIVRLEHVEDNTIYFKGVDILNGSPLSDIKPYYSYFDNREDARNGWLERKMLPPEELKSSNGLNNK